MIRNILSLTWRLAAAMLLLGAPAVATASRPVSHDEAWTLHSSFDNRPRMVIDTPDAVYLFGHQSPYYKTGYKGQYSKVSGAVFKFDKNNQAVGLQDLAQSINFSGQDMRFFTVSPSSGIMAVAYDDGGIDVITPAGRVYYFDDLKSRTTPRAHIINNLAFDALRPSLLWVATAQGYLCIDASQPAVVTDAEWDKAVTDLASAGDKVVAVVGGKICEAPASADLTRIDSFTEIEGIMSGVAGRPLRVLGLSPSHFAYVTDGGVIVQATRSGDAWTKKALRQDGAILQAANSDSMVAHRLDHTAVATPYGWYIASAANAVMLTFPATDGAEPGYALQALPSGNTMFSSSADKSEWWFYRERGKLVKYTLADGNWSNRLKELHPAAPLLAGTMYFIYSPEYGLIALNDEGGAFTNYNYARIGPLPSVYKDGKWRIISSAYNSPYYMSEHPEASSNFSAYPFRFPVTEPVGFSLDPLNPEILHYGSNWDGTASINLRDPRLMPVMCISPDNPHKVWPSWQGFYTGSWSGATNMRILGCDDDQNLWMLRTGQYDGANPRTSYYLYWWTPEARRQALAESDATLAGDWQNIRIELDYQPGFYTQGYMCRHPANKGLFIFAPNTYEPASNQRRIIIYDTNGTPADTSDDTLRWASTAVTDRNATNTTFNYIGNIIEDPNTGEVLLLSSEVFIIDPRTAIDDNHVLHTKALALDSSEGHTNIISPFIATVGCHDEYGRLWLGTNQSGVIGLSADRSKVVTHYTAENSPLPANNVVGIGWNPDTKSVFASTYLGIAEVRVDGEAAASNPYDRAIAVPASVDADFGGTVAIHNVPGHMLLQVFDSEGRRVAVLPAAVDGITHWDLTDSEGRMVRSGQYRIRDSRPEPGFREIILPVMR